MREIIPFEYLITTWFFHSLIQSNAQSFHTLFLINFLWFYFPIIIDVVRALFKKGSEREELIFLSFPEERLASFPMHCIIFYCTWASNYLLPVYVLIFFLYIFYSIPFLGFFAGHQHSLDYDKKQEWTKEATLKYKIVQEQREEIAKKLGVFMLDNSHSIDEIREELFPYLDDISITNLNDEYEIKSKKTN